jgi:hypothetical protein
LQLLENPRFRAKQGSNWMEMIRSIAQQSGKTFYFDAHGNMRYEDWPFKDFYFGTGEDGKMADPTYADMVAWYTTDPTQKGQTVFNAASQESCIEDVYNNIWIMTSSPNREIIFGNNRNWASLNNAGSEGFLGFDKTLVQREGTFGSEEAMRNVMKHYNQMNKPPVAMRFESFGLPVKALDLVSLLKVDDNSGVSHKYPLVVINASTTINASENRWWQTIDAEWLGGTEVNNKIEIDINTQVNINV